jgi:hypothetical protein
MAIEFSLETVLAVIIILITANLLFIGFYIISVLREVKKTVSRAGAVIDEVDKSVKDGVEKAKAINAPMQALATTTAALGGIMKTGEAIRKATQSILGGGAITDGDVIEGEQSKVVVEAKPEEVKPKETKVSEKPLKIENTPTQVEPSDKDKDFESDSYEVQIETDKKKMYRKPRFFKKR